MRGNTGSGSPATPPLSSAGPLAACTRTDPAHFMLGQVAKAHDEVILA